MTWSGMQVMPTYTIYYANALSDVVRKFTKVKTNYFDINFVNLFFNSIALDGKSE